MLEKPAELLDRLEQSGLLSPSIIERRDALLGTESAEKAADKLVRLNLLTEYQARVAVKDDAVPLSIGDYIVEDMIGRGGMGFVLKARHRRMKRQVAIKFLHKSMTESPDLVARFEREVEAAAQLHHQNIVTAYDAGEHDGSHYLVMQYVEGEDLSHRVKRDGPLRVSEAIDVIRQTAEGLGYAHEKGIVHRDIKPGNLLLDREGVVRILDMGLARMRPSPGDALDGGAHADLTNTGSVMGTVDYMAPEQALDAKTADFSADIYSLGCTLYFLLTSNPPFRSDTIMRRLLAHREQDVPLISHVRPEAPSELDQVFATMMAKKKEDRYPSMRHLIVALNSIEFEDSEAEQMATIDAPDDGTGGFIKLPDADQLDDSVEQSAFSDSSATTPTASRVLDTASSAADATLIESDSQLSNTVVVSDADSLAQNESFSEIPSSAISPPESTQQDSGRRKSGTPWKIIAPGIAAVLVAAILFAISQNGPDESPTGDSLAGGGAQSAAQNSKSSEATASSPADSTLTDKSANRRAAEWVLSLGGSVRIQSDGENAISTKQLADLPADAFQVLDVDLSGSQGELDKGLSVLQGVTRLEALHLSKTQVTDRGLANVTDEGRQPLANLRRLYLDGTDVTENGLRHFAASESLNSLLLSDTAVRNWSVLSLFSRLSGLSTNGVPSDATELTVKADLSRVVNLKLDAVQLSDEVVQHLSDAGRIQDLLVYDLPSKFDARILSRFQTLDTLGFHSSDPRAFDDVFWKRLSELPAIEKLHFTYGIDNQSLEGVQQIPGVTMLAITSKDVSGSRVAKTLSRLKSLTSLSVTFSDWTDEDIRQLPGDDMLMSMNLVGNTFTRAELERLATRYPRCRIESDHGTFEPLASQVTDHALSFDGVDDFVAVPSLQYEPGQPFTIEATVSDWGDGYGVICGWRASASLSLSGDKLMAGLTTTDLPADKDRKIQWPVKKEKPLRIALVNDGTEARLFVDGQATRPMKLTAPLKPSESGMASGFAIGAIADRTRGFMAPLNATIDEVRVSNVARYDSDYDPVSRLKADDDTTAIFHFDQGEGNLLRDRSGNGHDGTIHGATWLRIAGDSLSEAEAQKNRQAAEWALSIGGTLLVRNENEMGFQVSNGDELPEVPFHVVFVNLSQNENLDDEGLKKLRGLSQLQSLTAWGTSISDRGLGNLTDEGREPLLNLETLSVGTTGITETGLRYLAGSQQLSQLRIGETRISDLSALKLFPQLKSLELRKTQIPAEDLAALQNNDMLTYLVIDGAAVSGVGGTHLATLGKLTKLEIHGNRDEFAPATLLGLKQLVDLRLLSPHESLFDEDFWATVAGLPELASISFSNCLADETLAGLRPMPQLQKLGISQTRVSGPGIVGASSKLPNLTDLMLTGAALTDDDAQHVQRLTRLAHLDVTANEITAAGIESLRKALPRCHIKSDHGTFEPDPDAASPDRRAAAWVLKHDGFVVVKPVGSAEGTGVKPDEKLPAQPFQLMQINLNKSAPEAEFRILAGLTSLEAAYINYFPLTDPALANLKDSSNLRALHVEGTRITDAGLSILTHFPSLESLQLPAGMTDKGFQLVLKVDGLKHLAVGFKSNRIECLNRLPELSRLESLALSYTDVRTDASGAGGLGFLRDLPSLTSLRLSRCLVDSRCLRNVAELDRMREVILHQNRVESETLTVITEFQNLEALSMVQAGLTDADVDLFSELSELKSLNVTRNDITSEGIATLRKSLPGCQIESDHGTFEASAGDTTN